MSDLHAAIAAALDREQAQAQPPPPPWEAAWAAGSEVECCASGQCEVCAPGGFGGSRYWS